MKRLIILLVAVVLVLVEANEYAINVPASVDKTKISVSGLSAGGFMAVQYHVAFSSQIMGAGVIAGGPYYCAQNDLLVALYNCMPGVDVFPKYLSDLAEGFAEVGSIDSLSNLASSRVYLFSGLNDTEVAPITMKDLEEFYGFYINQDNIKTEYSIKAEHAFPTLNYGSACAYFGPPYINNCGYDGAGNILQQIYGSLKPSVNASGTIQSFDQSKYLPSGYTLDEISFGPLGYLYVPSGCQNSSATCWLHIAFHGCEQTIVDVQSRFYTETGYNTWAEANNIIVVYPQVKRSPLIPYNPKGCFDWWGYSGPFYAVQDGPQMQTVQNIINTFKLV